MNKKYIAITLIIVLILNLIGLGLGIISITVFWAIILIIFFISNYFFKIKE